jgi:polyferredoxin
MQATVISKPSATAPEKPTGGVAEKFDRSYVRWVRYAFQWGLFFLILYGGYRLYLFAAHFMAGETPLVERPPLVDGFLPIGSLMTLRLWLSEGMFDPVHPSGIVILATALAMSLLLKKSFCGWVCPVGALSELLYKAGARAFGRNFRMHRYADYALRSLKYLLLGFFLNVVLFKMSSAAIAAFLGTPYWKVADIKMLHFFTDMSVTTMVVLGALVVLSLFFKNFWCRYLCPYGALVGLLSFFSPLKITRNEEACIHCSRCTKHCPSLLPVEERQRVRSPECTGCLTCVSRCPAKGALDISLPARKPLKPMVFAALVAVVFFGAIGAAKLTGNWQSATTYKEYKALVPIISRFEHP